MIGQVRGVARSGAQFAQSNRIPTVVFLFFLLVVIRTARDQWRLPDRRQTAGYIGVSLLFVVLASVVPGDLVALFLGAVLVAALFNSGGVIGGILDGLTRQIGGTPTYSGTRQPAGAGLGLRGFTRSAG